MIKNVVALVLSLICLGCSDHAPSESDFPSRSVTVNGTEYKYRIYVPQKRDPNVKIPVMLYLHGSGSHGDDNRSQLGGMAPIIGENPELIHFVIVFPQCRTGQFWAGEMNEQAFAALDQTIKEFNGDENRLYLAGFSMGGNGTWQIGLVHPGKFAALVPIAGEVAPRQKLSDEVLASLAPRLREAAISSDPYKVFAVGIGNTPVWVFHGSEDDAVPVTESRKIVEALRKNGNQNVNYTEFENTGHLIVGKAMSDLKLFEWLAQQNK